MAPKRDRKHTCKPCGKTHHNPDDLTAHMISEHGHPELVCSEIGCNKTFKAPRTLKRHLKEQHEGLVFSCNNCGNFSCSRRENLKRHEKSCSKKHGQNGCVDNSSAVSAPVPSLPAAIPVMPATEIYIIDSESQAMSRASSFSSSAASGLAIDPSLVSPVAISSCSPKDLWTQLWYQAIDRAAAVLAARYPCGSYQQVLPFEERVQMQNLILEQLNRGRIHDNVAEGWFSCLTSMETHCLGLSESIAETWYL